MKEESHTESRKRKGDFIWSIVNLAQSAWIIVCMAQLKATPESEPFMYWFSLGWVIPFGISYSVWKAVQYTWKP